MAVFFAAGFPVMYTYGTKAEEVVSVAPQEIPIQQLPYATYGDFVIHNNEADKTQFDVWVVITFDDGSHASRCLSS